MTTILIVDDRADNREFLTKLLSFHGFQVLQATNGAEALDVTREAGPDLVIADILMPVMDGYDFVHELRSDTAIPQPPIIFYTAAYQEREASALASACGVARVLIKPCEPKEIMRCVEEVLHQPVLFTQPTTFEREHRNLLTNKLADKVTELETTNARLSMLIELGQLMASERDQRRLLEQCSQVAREIIHAECSVVGIVDDQRALRYCYAGGIDTQTVEALSRLPPYRELLESLLDERRSHRSYERPRAPFASFLATSLATPERIYGWLFLANRTGETPFSAEDERILTALAAQVAVAYESRQHYEAIQRHAAELERRVEERTAELHRSNAELEQFAYVASHDLQEPLRMVSSYVQLLQRRYQGQLDSKADMYIEYAVDGAARMQTLIQDLLAYSRVGRANEAFAPADCGRVLNQVLASLAAAIADTRASVTAGPLPTVLANAGQLAQLLQNLIGNAIKFHGVIAPHVHISATRRGAEWVFAVRDNGIGIDPQNINRIFEIFQRLHTRQEYEGTGIGLAICKRIVEHHGGQIWVESRPAAGATFYFTLPEVEGVHDEPAPHGLAS
jgi:signal transduction histidine kinase/DNA-binding response OmpR family regulator